jgi:rhodanese-related sulfurtransferase
MDHVEFYKAKLEFETDSWDLSEAIKGGEAVVVIDTRSKEAYEHEHIPGAMSLPHRTISPESTAHLDRSKLYVTYCDGIGCNASTKGALKLASLGFKVKELLGGLDWWRRDGYETHGKNATAGKSINCAC